MKDLETKAPKIFISYSWSSKDHQKRVGDFAVILQEQYGIEVLLDIWHLKPGQDKYAFMEKSVNDESITHVLMICDEDYKYKANERVGGVGTETTVITPEIYSEKDQTKFIPIIFEYSDSPNDSLPSFLKSRMYFDLSLSNKYYYEEKERLIRFLWNEPLEQEPKLGKKPEFLENKLTNLAKLKSLISQSDSRNTNLKIRRKIVGEYILMMKEITEPLKESENNFLIILKSTLELQDMFTEWLESIMTSEITGVNEISKYVEIINTAFYDTSVSDYNKSKILYFEFLKFIEQELIIRIVAILYVYELYVDLHKFLNKTYFINKNYYTNTVGNHDISDFYKSLESFEEIYKNKNDKPDLHSSFADAIIKRVDGVALSKQDLVEADLIIHHFVKFRKPKSWGWFPRLYIYGSEYTNPWGRLISKSYALNFMEIFG